MLSWILAALIGAVPLYFGFHHGRKRSGVALLTSIGVMLSAMVVGLVLATSATSAAMVIPALALAYLTGVAAFGVLAGGIFSVVLGR